MKRDAVHNNTQFWENNHYNVSEEVGVELITRGAAEIVGGAKPTEAKTPPAKKSGRKPKK